ncbi:MAG: M24 family metallopeptidase, partial [Verrucomicrobia bacterium]|nr:M24 family metallopeptidase [Verrucomicrobiota bacterium]
MKKLTGSVLIVGAPESVPDLVYATGFSAVDPVAYLKTSGHRFLVVPSLEAGRATRQVKKGIRVLTPADLVHGRSTRRKRKQWIIALLRKMQRRSLVVPAEFPVGLARHIERAGFRVKVATAAIFPGRLVKNGDEILRMQRVQRAAVRAMRRAVALIRRAQIRSDGVLHIAGRVLTSERVRREIDQALLEQDCAATDTIAAGGTQGADPHERGSGPLRAGEPIVLDIFPRSRTDGYWGDLTRTVVRGRATPEVRRMYRAVKRAQAAALRKVRAGAAVSVIHR